jgi:hypothetical protein
LPVDFLLAIGQVFGLSYQVADLPARLLATHPGERLLRFAEPVGRAASLCLTVGRPGLLGRSGPAHVPQRLFQPVDRLIQLLLVLAISGHLALLVHPLLALLTLLAGLAVLLALLAPLSGLLTLLPRLAALLALLPLLAGLLSLLPLLTLLIAAELAGVVPAQLLHLLLQLLGFAPQHLLLIALLRSLRLVAALLLGEFLLALCKLLQFLHRLIDFALPGVG